MHSSYLNIANAPAGKLHFSIVNKNLLMLFKHHLVPLNSSYLKRTKHKVERFT